MIYRAYKYRLWPTDAQAESLNCCFAAVRQVYNAALEQRRTYGRRKGSDAFGRDSRFNAPRQAREINFRSQAGRPGLLDDPELRWITETPRDCLDAALRDLDKAFDAFFAGRAGFPSFRSADRNNSLSFRAWCRKIVAGRSVSTPAVIFGQNCVTLPKFGRVRYRRHRKFYGDPKTVEIIREGAEFYVILTCAQPDREIDHHGDAVGVDLGVAMVKVNPLQARRFAEAHGTRAKTDAVDAQMLARMGAAFDLAPQAPRSKESLVLRDLHVARTGLIKDRTRLRNRARTQDIAVLKRQAMARLGQMERQIAELDAEIAALIEARETTARIRDILCSIPGISTVTAAVMLTLLPEIGALERKKVASLAGLAPITRQSGQWQGKAFIGGGRKPLRDALYMPALVAMRYNPDLKAKYEDLRTAGKPAKVAIVAVMRKLIEMANALVKADRTWTPKTA